jgi:hypothetical protein
MKRGLKIFQLIFLICTFGILSVAARPRVIKGTVYRDGKPASGVRVTVHKSRSSYFTSFDGKYELKADVKSKWIKFGFPDKVETLVIDANSPDTMDYGAPAKKSVPDASGTSKRIPEKR